MNHLKTMKQPLLTLALGFAAISLNAQTVITDTVSMGAPAGGVSYPNQVWYSLPDGDVSSAPRTEWDLAFDVKTFVSGVRINSPKGMELWKYPNGDLATAWETIDTTGLSGWEAHHNSDTSWELGAIGRYADPENDFNLDWGTYNMTTHTVTGDSLYIIKLASGDYKKFAIESLAGSVFTFKYANLDGSDAHTQTITKSNFADKNFAYVNLTSNSILDREPTAASWDLTFTQYTTFIGIPYGVTGVLQNRGVTTAKVTDLADVESYTNWEAHAFSSEINTIGYDWKSFTGGSYSVADSQLYFVKRKNGDVWKLIFKGFGGSANGNFIFSREKIFTAAPTSVADIAAQPKLLQLFPNPATTQATVVCDFGTQGTPAVLELTDLTGRSVKRVALGAPVGLQQYNLPLSGVAAGTYLLSVQTAQGRLVQKLIIQ